MLGWKRGSLLLGAVASLTAAVVLVINIGLPQRAQFTGRIDRQGLSFAPEINAFAPPFKLTSIDGEQINLIELRGKPVVINFWATWCEPCRVEMPVLQHVYETYETQGLKILAVNLREPLNAVHSWVTALGLTFDILLDSDSSVAALYYLRGQPSTFIIDPEGIIVQVVYGPIDEANLHRTLAPYFSS